jgi:hypothetical protein
MPGCRCRLSMDPLDLGGPRRFKSNRPRAKHLLFATLFHIVSYGKLKDPIRQPTMAQKEEEKAGLLSPTNYDEDAASVSSDGEVDSDGEDSVDGRTSGERTRYDSEVLADDYEEEDQGADGSKPGVGLKQLFKRGAESKAEKMTIKERRASRRHRERLKRGELESELVYDMEEGGQASQSPSRNSSESDLRRLGLLQEKKKQVGCLVIGIVATLTQHDRQNQRAPSSASSSTPPSLHSSCSSCSERTARPKKVVLRVPSLPPSFLCQMEPPCLPLPPFLYRSTASAPTSSNEG